MRSIHKILLCLAFATVAGGAFAQPGPGPGMGQGPRDPKAFLVQQGVSDAVAQQVVDLWTQALSAAEAKRADLKVIEAQIRQAMVPANPDLKAVNALVDRKVALQADLEKARLALEAKVHQLIGDPLFAKIQMAHRGMGMPGRERF